MFHPRALIWIAAMSGCAASTQARRPEPPPQMDVQLAGHFPLDQLHGHDKGFAKLLATVLPDGHLEGFQTIAHTAPTYSAACREMLSQSVWTPARDATGQPVRSNIRYTCEFETELALPPIEAERAIQPKRLVLVVYSSGFASNAEVRNAINPLGRAWVACVMKEDPPKQLGLLRLSARAASSGRIVEQLWVDPVPNALDRCTHDMLGRVRLPAKPGPTSIGIGFAFVESNYPACMQYVNHTPYAPPPFRTASIPHLHSSPACLKLELQMEP